MVTMPEVNINKLRTLLNEPEMEIANLVIKGDNTVRSSKPKEDGLAQYVWRMVVFNVSPKSAHHCMPVMAFFYLPANYGTEEYNLLVKIGNKIADAIIDCVNMNEWHGVKRWARVL